MSIMDLKHLKNYHYRPVDYRRLIADSLSQSSKSAKQPQLYSMCTLVPSDLAKYVTFDIYAFIPNHSSNEFSEIRTVSGTRFTYDNFTSVIAITAAEEKDKNILIRQLLPNHLPSSTSQLISFEIFCTNLFKVFSKKEIRKMMRGGKTRLPHMIADVFERADNFVRSELGNEFRRDESYSRAIKTKKKEIIACKPVTFHIDESAQSYPEPLLYPPDERISYYGKPTPYIHKDV